MNAIVHHKAQELNEGGYSSPSFFCLIPVAGARTSKANIQQIREAVKTDPALNPNTMSEEKKKELIDNLLKYRAVQSHGARVSNLAAAQDIAHTVQRIEQSVCMF